jgi:hypothetical protein
MEPRREQPKAPKPGTQERKKRFRIIKLEPRISPVSLNFSEITITK